MPANLPSTVKKYDFDPSNTGKYLNAEEFNKALDNPETIVIDMRNHYESEVGRFDNAFCPDADTFREELPLVINHLKGKEDKKIVMPGRYYADGVARTRYPEGEGWVII